MSKDSLGDRMKRHERASEQHLPLRTYTVIRADGKAFHTFTRHCEKPFDHDLIATFQQVSVEAFQHIPGLLCAYTQSDEISFVLHDFANLDTQPWYAGKVQKQASVTASLVTALFNNAYPADRTAMFDARTFTVPTFTELQNYLIWRQQDAERNSVSMAASGVFSDAQLFRKTKQDRRDMLEQAGQPWETLPEHIRYGTYVFRPPSEEVTFDRDGRPYAPKTREPHMEMEPPVLTTPEGREFLTRLCAAPSEPTGEKS